MSETHINQAFLPSRNGLHFSCNWPNKTPLFKVNILGIELNLLDAKDGLCGGLVYTVMDLFLSGLLPPIDTKHPDYGTNLFDYILTRQVQDFNFDNTNKLLTCIQMSNHDTIVGVALGIHGLAWHEVNNEWKEKIKPELDANRLCPLMLVYGQEPPGAIGYTLGVGDLVKMHVVLAYGYCLDDYQLEIFVYDPNHPDNDNCKICLYIRKPENTIKLQPPYDYWRGFFKDNYTYHNPTTPIVSDLVSAQGITSPGPLWKTETGLSVRQFLCWANYAPAKGIRQLLPNIPVFSVRRQLAPRV